MMLITMIVVWCVCIGVSAGMFFLYREIELMEEKFKDIDYVLNRMGQNDVMNKERDNG